MKKMWQQPFVLVLFFFAISVNGVSADELYVYPAKGQSQEQMEKDKYTCHEWAKQQTGFDPMAASSPSPTASSSGGVVKGAARGGLLGVAVGAIAGDAGKGAAIGAASGGLIGGMRQRDQTQKQEQVNQQQSAQYNHLKNNYNRAYGSCLSGRGYTVK